MWFVLQLLLTTLQYLLIFLLVAFAIFWFTPWFRGRLLPGIFYTDQWPVVGNWPALFANLNRFHDWKLDHGLKAQAVGAEILQRCGPFIGIVEIISPRMVEYVLKTNFDNFIKGHQNHDIFFELLGNGIFNTDGETWRHTRKAASHMFSASKLNNFMLTSFLNHAKTLSAILDKQLKKQESSQEPIYLDMQQIFCQYTMDAICEIGFGVNLDSLLLDKPPAFAKAFDMVQEATVWRLLYPPLRWKLNRLLNLGTEKIVSAHLPVIDEFVYGIIKTRKENAEMYEEAGDLLSLFIAEEKKNPPANHAETMTDKELRDLILNFMIAGRDTTAALLTWFFYELSERPAIYREVLAEIEEHFGALGEEGDVTSGLTHESLKKLVYLEAVMMETLRLHPPVPNDSKRSIKACTFPDGTSIPKDYVVAYSPYVMGRLKSIWGEDVAEFKPDRWLTEPDVEGERTLIQKSAFAFPQFNAGFRLCLGKSMAILEAKVVAVSVLRKHRLILKPGHDAVYKLGIVLFMKNGLAMQVAKKE